MKVLVFGTFDLLHKGHDFFLSRARSYGDLLTVVVARDATVISVKGRAAQDSEQTRLKNLMSSPHVTLAVLGNLGDKYAIIEKIRPDIICLGYDQRTFVDKLPAELKKRGLNVKIIQITESFEPEKYKSSKLRKN